MGQRSHRRAALVALILCGFVLRVAQLDANSFWLDELIQVYIATRPLAELPAVAHFYGNMPLDILITRVMLRLGEQDLWLRLPAAWMGTLSIPLMYQITYYVLRNTYVPGRALLAAMLLAVAPLAVQFSRELRPYSLLLLASLAATLLYLEASRRAALWPLYALAMLVALHTHLFAFPLLVLHGLHWLAWQALPALWRRQGLRMVMRPLSGGVAFAATLALFVVSPLSPSYLLRFTRAAIGGLSGPTVAERLSLGPSLYEFPDLGLLLRYLPADLTASWPWGVPALVLAVTGVAALRRRPAELSLLLLWVVTPLALILYALAQRNQFYAVRYVIIVLPPLLLLVAAGLAVLFQQPAAWIRQGAAPLITLLFVASLAPALRQYIPHHQENWRDAAAYIRQLDQPDALIVAPVVAPFLAAHYLKGVTLHDLSTGAAVEILSQHRAHAYVLQSRYSRIQWPEASWLHNDNLEAYFSPAVGLYRAPVGDLATWFLAQRRQAGALFQTRAEFYPQDLRQAAMLARAGSDWPTAIMALEALVQVAPGDGGIWAELGFAYQQRRRSEDAASAYRRAIELDGNNPWSRLLLANILRQQGNPAEALAFARQAVDIAPELAAAAAALGNALMALEQPGEAVTAFEHGLATNPDDLGLRLGRAHALSALGEAAAWDAWLAVIDLNPPPEILAAACYHLSPSPPPACHS